MEATARDLRFHSKEVIDAAARGESVIITYHGKPVAKIIPIQSARKSHTIKPDKRKIFGMWRDHSGIRNVDNYVRSLRKGRFCDY